MGYRYDLHIPTLYTLEQVGRIAFENNPSSSNDGIHYVPARPLNAMGGLSDRLRVAWMVFTGRADAFTWPQGQ